MKWKILILMVFGMVLVVSNVIAYPIIISEQGINHTEAKQLVYSIPKAYYKYVNSIEIINKRFVHCSIYDNYGQQKCNMGWNWIYWDLNHNCYSVKINVGKYESQKTLIHELGHVYEYCELKRDISTEEFADNFVIK